MVEDTQHGSMRGIQLVKSSGASGAHIKIKDQDEKSINGANQPNVVMNEFNKVDQRPFRYNRHKSGNYSEGIA